MGIVTQWDNAEQTAIRFIYQGQWTWVEFHASIDIALEMAASVSHPIDHIYDVTESASLPSGALSQFRGLRNRVPQNLNRRVLVGAGSLTRMLAQTMLSLYPGIQNNFSVVNTLDEARLWLASSAV